MDSSIKKSELEPTGTRDLSLLHSVQTYIEVHWTYDPVDGGGSFSGGKAAVVRSSTYSTT